MPCLAENPTQVEKLRKSHKHAEINVLAETLLEVPSSTSASTDEEAKTQVGLRKLVNAIDFGNTNVTEEELNARLAAFDIVGECHTLATQRHHRQSSKLTQTLVESMILDTPAIRTYRVPLCFRETDDDLEVVYSEQESALD